MGPGRGGRALPVRSRARRSAPAARLSPRPVGAGRGRGLRRRCFRGRGRREAWAGGGADAECSSGWRGQGAERSGTGSAPAGRLRGLTTEPNAWCSILSPRYEQEPGVWALSALPIAQPPRPRRPLCPLPAGRRRDGVSGGFLEVASPSEGSGPTLRLFLRLLAPLALGVGHRREGRFSASRSSPTPGQADEALGQPSLAAGEAWSSGPLQRRGREAGPGCGLRAWAPCAAPCPLHRGGPRITELPGGPRRPGQCRCGWAPGPAPESRAPGGCAVPPVVRAQRPDSPAAGRHPSAGSAPSPRKCPVGGAGG